MWLCLLRYKLRENAMRWQTQRLEWCSCKAGNLKDCQSLPETRRGKKELYQSLRDSRVLPTPWYQASSLQNVSKYVSAVLSHHFVVLSYSSLKKLIQYLKPNFWIFSKPLPPISSVQFSSASQSCPTLCDPIDCITPGFPVHCQHPKPTQTHVHHVSDAMQPSHPLSSPSPPTFNLSQHQGFFPLSQFSASGGQSIGVSALTSVLSINIQGWFSLGWTGWISLQSKGLSRVFSNTTIQKHQFFGAQLSL